MFKFTDSKNNIDRLKKAKTIKENFSPLKSKINIINSYEIGINSKTTKFSYDIILISEYNSWEDLNAYINHPEHKKAIQLCADIKKEKAVIDYEL